MARVKQIFEKSDIAREYHDVFDELAVLRGHISGPSSIVMHSPQLAHYWNEISVVLHTKSIVESPHAELAVCATAREWECPYIWATHVPAARAAGISEEAIKAVAHKLDIAALPEHEAAVVSYVRHLHRFQWGHDGSFDWLLREHGPRWILELTCWVGRYAALVGFLNGFEVSGSPDADVLPFVSRNVVRTEIATGTPPLAPRISMITSREQVEETDRGIFDAVAEGRGNVRGPFAFLMHSPTLCKAVLNLSNYLREDNVISAYTRELAILATARERDCPHVWAAHAPAARTEGVPDAVVAIVRDRGDLVGLSPRDADVIEYVRQIMRAHWVESALFDRMLAEHSLQGLVEITAVVGHYVFVTTVRNAFEMAPMGGADLLPRG